MEDMRWFEEEVEEIEESDDQYEVESSLVGETRIGLALCHYTVYKNGKVVGEAEDEENSIGGYSTVAQWGDCGIVTH